MYLFDNCNNNWVNTHFIHKTMYTLYKNLGFHSIDLIQQVFPSLLYAYSMQGVNQSMEEYKLVFVIKTQNLCKKVRWESSMRLNNRVPSYIFKRSQIYGTDTKY